MLSIASSPMRSSFAVSAFNNKVTSNDKSRLLDCDMKTMKIQVCPILTFVFSTRTLGYEVIDNVAFSSNGIIESHDLQTCVNLMMIS